MTALGRARLDCTNYLGSYIMIFIMSQSIHLPIRWGSSARKGLYMATLNCTLRLMAKNKKNEGFHSAAGLIRYFDSEDDKALKVSPWLVVGMCIAASVIVMILGTLYPT